MGTETLCPCTSPPFNGRVQTECRALSWGRLPLRPGGPDSLGWPHTFLTGSSVWNFRSLAASSSCVCGGRGVGKAAPHPCAASQPGQPACSWALGYCGYFSGGVQLGGLGRGPGEAGLARPWLPLPVLAGVFLWSVCRSTVVGDGAGVPWSFPAEVVRAEWRPAHPPRAAQTRPTDHGPSAPSWPEL